ncbi:hypothetical protein BUALT_Bualt02G0154900 [Buddleja alternifolia]|uniref:Uncharacterized protein n=1 Tax=Buddleja alternifolia TaxID=168488 RepID=A0AAV6Y6P5_9LAMI|nr:hypothetical protein BUALT_Bualt02G0154900 [Buddleja alternifolia]
MQCTSYFPIYYHLGDLSIGVRGSSSHMFNSNADCGEERGYNVSLPPRNMDQYPAYDKEVLRQIIQNHEATFRYQVGELHRLYQRQRELMDETRVREIFTQHFLSQTLEPNHCSSQALPDSSQTTSRTTSWILGDHSHHKLSVLTAERIQQPPDFVAKNIQEPVKSFPVPLIRKNGSQEIESVSSKGTEKRILDLELPADVGEQFEEGNQHASDSDIGSVTTRDSSRCFLNKRKINTLIDLNEPVQHESTGSSSGLLNCDTGPGGINSSMAIDLNYLPVDCFPENGLNKEFLKIETQIDLNISVVIDEPSLPTIVGIKSAGDIDLVGPVSPENKECSPPRGKSEDIQIKTRPLLSDTIAAQTLVMISSSDKSLVLFAEIVSSIGDDLENEIVKLHNRATDHGQNELPNGINDLCEENARVFRQEAETDTLSGKSRKGHAKRTSTLRRNAGKKAACSKLRKHPKLSTSDVVKKGMNSTLKMPVMSSKHGVLLSWGKVKKRRGGRRHRANKNFFLFVS